MEVLSTLDRIYLRDFDHIVIQIIRELSAETNSFKIALNMLENHQRKGAQAFFD